jgi:glycosyltransferase XagB
VRDPHIGAILRPSAGPPAGHAAAEGPAFAARHPQDIRRACHTLAPCPEIDCVRHLLPPGVIAAAQLRAAEIGTGADRVLVAQKSISDDVYARALAFSLGLRFDSLERVARAACPASDVALLETARTGLLWLSAGRQRILVVAPQNLAARRLIEHLRLWPDLSAGIWLTSHRRLSEFVRRKAAAAISQKAISELKSERPEFSATALRSRLAALLLAGGLAAIAAFLAAPALMTIAVDIALALVFLGWTGLRVLGAVTARLLQSRERDVAESQLPFYSIIVALYREAATVEGLVASLRALDYPPEKLDIMFVLEPDDHETRQALSRLPLDPAFRIVAAPKGGPRTKPKALNAALPLARGSFLAVFDAEDRPEPDQLRKALRTFKAGGTELACVQARLCIDNFRQSWLTRMFAAEYAGLFDVFLPGLAACRLPLPLGGSSNHFRTWALREAGAWDPYNVTEDADLGMRLARLGFHTTVIDSTTYEEAPAQFMPWLRQRTRWFKGWMQTWLVHMRRPVTLWRDLGTSGFLVFQLVVGGTVLAAMVHGVFAIALGWQIASGWLWAEKEDIAETLIAGLHLLTLVSGYVISGLLGVAGLARRGMLSCGWALLLTPLYWFLLSIAAWRALFHFLLEPHAWEKTEHRLARIWTR